MTHLYVMSRSDAPGVLKVGRSDEPERRATQLQSGHCFWVNVQATFKGYGGLERHIHRVLEHTREQGAGKEWFRTDLHVVLSAITLALRTDNESNCGDSIVQHDDDETDCEDTTTQHEDEGQSTATASSDVDDALWKYVEPCESRNATKATCIHKALVGTLGKVQTKQLLSKTTTTVARGATDKKNRVLRAGRAYLKLREASHAAEADARG